MAVQYPAQTRGFILVDPKLLVSARDTTSALLDTATQASGVPGIPVSNSSSMMALQGSGEVWSGDTLTLRAVQGGDSIPGDQAGRFAWTGGTVEGATERGWLPHNVATGFFQLVSTASLNGATYPGVGAATKPCCIRRSNGDVIFAFVSTYLTVDSIVTAQYDASVGRFKPPYGRYDPGGAAYVYDDRAAWSWTVDAVSNTNAGGAPSNPCLLELPTGRLLCFFTSSQAYAGGVTYYAVGYSYSDDGGATWTFASKDTGARVSSATGTPIQLHACYLNGCVTLLLVHDGAASSSVMTHWYSTSNGARFTQVANSSGSVQWSPVIVPCDDGSVLLFFIKGGEGRIWFSRKYAAAVDFGTETAINPGPGSVNKLRQQVGCLAATILEDRTVAVMAVTADDGVNAPGLRYLRFPQNLTNYLDTMYVTYNANSYDAEPIDYGAGTGQTQHIPSARSLCVWGSQLLLVSDQQQATSASICQLFGGYSSIDWNGPTFGIYPGVAGSQTRYGAWWDSAYKPSSCAIWTCTGAGAEGSSVEKLLSYDFSGGASTRVNARNGTAGADVWCWMRVRQDAGGSLTAAQSGVVVLAANGVTEYQVQVRLTTTAIRAYNVHGAATIGTDVTGLTASTMLDVLVSLTATGRVVVWYKAATSQIWLRGPYGNATNTAGIPAAVSRVQWGCAAASTQKSTWAFVGSNCDGWTWGLPVSVTEPAQSRISFGHEFPLWPSFVADGLDISAVSGPAATGETWTVAPRFTYSVDNLDVSLASSPTLVWKSTSDAAEQIIGWDFTAVDGPDSALLGLYIQGANYLSLIVEQDDGAGGWVQQVALSTVVISGGFARSGYRVTAAGTDLTGSTNVGTDELAGSWAVLTNTGTNYYVKIDHNSAGTWNKSTGILTATFTISGSLSGLPTTGTIQIIAPEVSVVFKPTVAVQRYWRIRIPARTYASAPESYHQTAVLLFGPYVPMGWAWSNARTISMEPIQKIAETDNGQTTVTTLADRGQRTAAIQWTDAIPGVDTLGSTATPQAVTATSGGEAIANLSDPRQVESLLLRTKGAKYPVVLLPYIPQIDLDTGNYSVVRSRDMQLYGRIVNGSTRTEAFSREGVATMTTISELMIQEVK